MALVGYNKRILDLTVGAPGSTHDARFLRNTGLVASLKTSTILNIDIRFQIWR